MTLDLFANQLDAQMHLAEDAYYLRNFALPVTGQLCELLSHHLKTHPPLQMMTPMGYQMSVRTTSFGALGWVASKVGYGYATINPETQQPWPSIPDCFMTLAQRAAEQVGFMHFIPDTCLVNVYDAGSKMGLHQDKDECDFTQPIVSVSLGLPVTFQFGGLARTDSIVKLQLNHGDVVVWGGKSRLCFHGVLPIKVATHAVLGQRRINLTFRKAGKM